MVAKWQKVGSPEAVTPSFFGKRLLLQKFEDPNGNPHDFYLYALKESVVVLPVSADGYVLTVREYKQGSDEIQQGLVGGYNDAGETDEDAARREVREETGYRVGRLIDLGYVWIIPRHSNGRVRLFLAVDCVLDGEQHLDESEGQIEVVPIPLKTWIDQVLAGETSETFSIAATTRALRHLGLNVARQN